VGWGQVTEKNHWNLICFTARP